MPDIQEASLENVTVEDVGHAARELDELFQCWTDRLTLNNLRFSERYLKGELIVMLDLVGLGGAAGVVG